VHIDADLENYPEDIPRLLEHMDRGYDFVCGYREDRQGPWLTRRLPSSLINAYVRRQTGTDIRDVGCGLRALDASLIRDLESEGEGRRLLTPVILRRARRIIQVPVRHRAKDNRGGHSFVSLLGIAADYYMLTMWRPFLMIGFVSAAVLIAGLVVLLLGGTVSGVLLVGGGALGALGSLVGEYAQRMYQLMHGAPFYELRDLGEKPQP
jgi:dolichol-phosphate mannosyltransferase